MKGKRGGAGSKAQTKQSGRTTQSKASQRSVPGKELRGSSVHAVRGKPGVVRETKGAYVVRRGDPLPPGEESSFVAFGASRKVKSPVVSVTAEEAARMPSRTDFARIDATTDEDIERAVAGDPDAAPIFTDEMFDQARWVEPLKKTPISFRVDPDVLEFFKEGGAGYQSRMNAVLRAYMHRSKKK